MGATHWLASLVAALTLFGCGSYSASGDPPPDCDGPERRDGAPQPLVTYHRGAFPRPDLSLINGVDGSLLTQASGLVDFHADDLAGWYVCEDSQVVVVATTDRGDALASKRFADDTDVLIRRGDKSLTEVNDLGIRLIRSSPSLETKALTLAIDPFNTGLKFGVIDLLDKDDKTGIEAFANKHDLPIDVYIDTTAERPSLG